MEFLPPAKEKVLKGCIPSLASKHEHVAPKHPPIGCRTRRDWSSNIWSLADRNAKMFTQYFLFSNFKMVTVKKYCYTRSKTIFTKGVCILTQFRVNISEQVFNVQSCAELLAQKFAPRSANFKCLMTNHAAFDTQLEHVSTSRVHAYTM